MRTFKKLNVIKITDNDIKAERYLDAGFEEVEEVEEVNEDLTVKELKEILDSKEVEYPSKITKAELIELVRGE